MSCTAAKRIHRQETLEVGPEMNWLNIYSSNPIEEKNVIFVMTQISKESLIFNFFRNYKTKIIIPAFFQNFSAFYDILLVFSDFFKKVIQNFVIKKYLI